MKTFGVCNECGGAGYICGGYHPKGFINESAEIPADSIAGFKIKRLQMDIADNLKAIGVIGMARSGNNPPVFITEN